MAKLEEASVQVCAPPARVFISYSHRDKIWRDKLATHLQVFHMGGFIHTWSDQNIMAGDWWLEGIEREMNRAAISILLITADFLISPFIIKQEVPRLLERRSQEGMAILPIIVRSCLWQEVPWLSKMQVRPLDGKPLAKFRGDRLDSELTTIAREVLHLARIY